MKSADEYIRSFKSICDELAITSKSIAGNFKDFGFLNGLGNKYKSFATEMS